MRFIFFLNVQRPERQLILKVLSFSNLQPLILFKLSMGNGGGGGGGGGGEGGDNGVVFVNERDGKSSAASKS